MRRGPLPGGVDEDENPYRIADHFVDQTVTTVRGEFACPRDFSFMTQQRKVGEGRDGVAEQLIDAGGGGWVAGDKMIPDCGSVLLRLPRPDDVHAGSVIRARRAAKSTSTVSLERP